SGSAECENNDINNINQTSTFILSNKYGTQKTVKRHRNEKKTATGRTQLKAKCLMANLMQLNRPTVHAHRKNHTDAAIRHII
ncbi:hypothetical protein, partial [Salmonella enterica]|uniref:hypothetical protein n=1 Tax=Salmonella enterica TaxID=28901 RepID=UPI00398C7FF4